MTQEEFVEKYKNLKQDIAIVIADAILQCIKELMASAVSELMADESPGSAKDQLKMAIKSSLGQCIMDFVNVVVKDAFPTKDDWWKICPWEKEKPEAEG